MDYAGFVSGNWQTEVRFPESKNHLGKFTTMTDPITDMFNQIKNAQAVEKETVELPFSKIKAEICSILKRGSWITDFTKKGKGIQKEIKITLKYEDKIPKISGFKRVSKPGRRIYKGWKEIKEVRQGYGMAIISTSKGLMADKEARSQKLGGEMLCEVW